MGRPWLYTTACILAACSLDESGLVGDAGGLDTSTPDVGVDAPGDDGGLEGGPADTGGGDVPINPPCNLGAAFGNFVNLGAPADTGADEGNPSLTSDELTLYFARVVSPNTYAIFSATRTSTSQPFGNAAQLKSILADGGSSDTDPSVVDGLGTLVFSSLRGATIHYHLYSATGDGGLDGFGNLTILNALNAANQDDLQPFWASTVPEIWFTSNRNSGQLDLFTSTSLTIAPTAATTVNDAQLNDLRPMLSHDGLTLYFGRADTGNHWHVWRATRGLTSGPFGAPAPVVDFDSGNSNTLPGWLSVDGCRMYFTSDRGGGKGGFDLWLASR